MRLCCCKKIVVKYKTKVVTKREITFDFDFDVPIMIAKMDGFLPAQYRLRKKLDKEKSTGYFRKNPAEVSLESFKCLDTVF